MALFNPSMPNEADRVRRNTTPDSLARIDSKIEENIRFYASQPDHVISRRIEELEREWSMERWLEANASSLALSTLLLGLTVSRKWLLATGGVLSFLLLHAVEGWCPPLPLLRSLGIRTRGEIDRERYALKFLRGDFKSIPSDPEELKRNPAIDVYNAIRV
jgi:hypothetical protein